MITSSFITTLFYHLPAEPTNSWHDPRIIFLSRSVQRNEPINVLPSEIFILIILFSHDSKSCLFSLFSELSLLQSIWIRENYKKYLYLYQLTYCDQYKMDSHFVQSNPLFQTRLIRSPRYFEGRSNSLGFALMFSVIYYQLFRTRLFRIPRYFELIVLSLHLKSTPLFRTCQKQSTYIRAQLETYCILFELVLRN